DGRHRVGGAGTGGHHGTTGNAGKPRPGVGGVGGGLLVANVDDADAGVRAPLVNVDDVPAAEGEDRLNPLGLEGASDQVASGDGLRCGGGFAPGGCSHEQAPFLEQLNDMPDRAGHQGFYIGRVHLATVWTGG